MTTEASKLYTRTWLRSNMGFGSIMSFRDVAKIGLKFGLSELFEQEVVGAKWMLESPENDELFTDKDLATKTFGGVEGLATRNLQTKIEGFAISVDGASLVFAHSLLDGAALDYCRVIALIDPSVFLHLVKDQKTAIGDVLSQPAPDLYRAIVDSYLAKLDKESLFKKIDVLHSICKPEPKFSALRDYAYDQERLRALDTLRHNVVHQDGPTRLPQGDEDITYLRDTCNHLMGLINKKFSLRMDSRHF